VACLCTRPEPMEKPWILVKAIGPDGIYRCYAPLLEKHFTVVTSEEFHREYERCGHKIRAVFVVGPSPQMDRALLQALPNLVVVVNCGVGVDHLDIALINSFGVKTDSLPESSMGTDVSGATLGIIGMGRIGYQVAKRAKGFDMKILYHNRNRRAVGAVYCEKLDELLHKSDFVMVIVNLSPQTHKLIGTREIAMMKPTATLINISRGLVVDQDALLDALQRRAIRAAALDVTYPEPLPRDHPLLALPNVIVLPHMGTHTVETMRVLVETMVNDALAAISGKEPPNEVKV
ncbi:hypothetical protein Z043_113626, partial [Scleropages formosus]